MPSDKSNSFDVGDLLVGADPIAGFLFGDTSQQNQKRVYDFGRLPPEERPPIFHVGARIAARKSRLITWMLEREQAAEAGCELRISVRGRLPRDGVRQRTHGPLPPPRRRGRPRKLAAD